MPRFLVGSFFLLLMLTAVSAQDALRHKDIGADMSKAEFEALDLHLLVNAADGDLIYNSGTGLAARLIRLPIGTDQDLLITSGTIPAWSDGTTWARANGIGYWEFKDVSGTTTDTLTPTTQTLYVHAPVGIKGGADGSAFLVFRYLEDDDALKIGELAGDGVAVSQDYWTAIGHYAGESQTEANSGFVAVGNQALRNSANSPPGTSSATVAMGNYAGWDYDHQGGVLIGDHAGADTGGFGDDLVAIGNEAGYESVAQFGVLIGRSAGEGIVNGSFNSQHVTAIGNYAGFEGDDVIGATGVGAYALYQATDAYYSSALGFEAGYQNSGNRLIAIGESAGYGNTYDYGIAIGANATLEKANSVVLGGPNSSEHVAEVSFGATTMASGVAPPTETILRTSSSYAASVDPGSDMVLRSGYSGTGVKSNVWIDDTTTGYGLPNTPGTSNYVLYSNGAGAVLGWADVSTLAPGAGYWTRDTTTLYPTTAADSIKLGTQATTSYLLQVGEAAGDDDIIGLSDGLIRYEEDLDAIEIENDADIIMHLDDKLVAIGTNAGNAYAMTASGGVFIGWNAGAAMGNVADCTYVGYRAGQAATQASNTFVGAYSGYNMSGTGAQNNVYVGRYAGYGASGATTSNNVAVGTQALQLVSSGAQNMAVGRSALYACTTGYSNMALGAYAGQFLQTGWRNTLVGAYSGSGGGAGNEKTYSDCVFIGAYSGDDITSQTNQLRIENNTGLLMSGDFSDPKIGIGTNLPNEMVTVRDINPGQLIAGFGCYTYATSPSYGAGLVLAKSDSDTEALNWTEDGDLIGFIDFKGTAPTTGGGNDFYKGAQIKAVQDGSVSNDTVPCDLVLATTGNSDQFVLDSGGTFVASGNGYVNGTTLITSERKHKEDIRDAYTEGEATALLQGLKSRSYKRKWKKDKADGTKEDVLSVERYSGFIVDEMPEALTLRSESADDENIYVDPMQIITLLVSAMQEQHTRIEALESRVEALEQ